MVFEKVSKKSEIFHCIPLICIQNSYITSSTLCALPTLNMSLQKKILSICTDSLKLFLSLFLLLLFINSISAACRNKETRIKMNSTFVDCFFLNCIYVLRHTSTKKKIMKENCKQKSSIKSATIRCISQQLRHNFQFHQSNEILLISFFFMYVTLKLIYFFLYPNKQSPLSIDPPEDLLEENQESMVSPIVINDKMLSHSAAVTLTPSTNQNSLHLSSPSGMDSYKAPVNGIVCRDVRIVPNSHSNNNAYNNFMDSDAINFLMELNEQDYECNIPVNDILKMM